MIPKKNKNGLLLKKANLRCTPARLKVLEALDAAAAAISQQQITAWLPDGVDKTTIYRTLDTLTRGGIIHRAFLKDRTWHYEIAANCGQTQCHPHFTCTACRTTFCFEYTEMPFPKTPANFDIHRQKILLEGLCPSCRKDKND